MEKKFLKLNDIGAYKISFNLSNYVWGIVLRWDYFAKDTVGKQFTRAKEEYEHIFNELQKLPRELNFLIKFTRDKLED